MQVTTCPSCSAQYNTAHMQSGAQFQCSNCGAMVLVQAAAPVQQQQYAQPQAAQVQRRSNIAAPQRGGAPAGRRQSQGFQQPAYGQQQQGYGQQQQGYGQQQGPIGYVPKKKSNTGLIIGIIGGSMAILVFVIVMATTGGSTMSEADMAVITAISEWQPGSPLPSEETIKKAVELRAAKNFPDNATEQTFNVRLADIEQTKTNDITDKYNKVLRDYKEKAQQAILATANAFTLALKSRDKEAIKNLIDWNQYYNYLTFNGQDQMIQANFPKPGGDTDEYYAPFSHKLKEGLVPKTDDKGQPVLDADGKQANMYIVESHTVRDIANMQTEGIEYLLNMYGTETINAVIDIDEKTSHPKVKGNPDIEGAPSGSSKTHYFYGDVNYDNGKGAHYEIANKPIRVFIGGEWGSSSAKIVALFDRTTKQWLTRIRDEAYHEKHTDTGDGGDTFREGMKTGDKTNNNGGTDATPGHPNTPSEAYAAGTSPKLTSAFFPAGHMKSLLETAIKDQKPIANELANFETFGKLSKKEQIAVFGFICDTILSVDAYATPSAKKNIVPKLADYFNGLARDEKLDPIISRAWQTFIETDRTTTHLEFAWRCGKLYEAYKNHY